jgi:hypothetical protein
MCGSASPPLSLSNTSNGGIVNPGTAVRLQLADTQLECDAMKWAPWLIGLVGLGIVGYGTYMRRDEPETVIRESRIEVPDPKAPPSKENDTKVAFKTRTVRVGGITTDQIQLPGGTWIDCAGDCRDALRKSTTDFWEEQRKKR